MSIYRRTIITLDDTQTQKDYMLFCVFEKLWPDMQSAQSAALHKTKSIDTAKHFDVGVHVDEVTINENVVDDPLPHVKLIKSVEMLWGKMNRDPDWGIDGFLLKNGHNDIDSVTELLPQTQSIQQVWGWFDVQRKMYDYLKANNIKLERIGVFTKKWLGLLQFKHDRAMVRVHHLRENIDSVDILLYVFRNNMIINAPAKVLLTCASAEAPPAVAVRLFHQLPETVDIAITEEIRHPLAFFGKEA